MRATTASLILFLAACTDATTPLHPPPRPSLGFNASGTTRVAVDPRNVALNPADSLRIQAKVFDGAGNLLPSQSVTWSTSNTAIATVSTLGTVHAKAVGKATVIARRNGAEDTTTVNVYLPGAGIRPLPGHVTRVGVGRNEPAGFTAISDRPFNSRAFSRTDDAAAEWWVANSEWSDFRFSITADATAPISPPNVGRIHYPFGMRGGGAAAGMSVDLPSMPRSMYASTAVKISSNYFGLSPGVNKLNFFFLENWSNVYLSAQGQGNAALIPELHMQGVNEAGRARNLRPNLVPGATITRGAWHRMEFLLIVNTPGLPNGEAHMWVDGVKIMAHSDCNYVASTDVPRWRKFSITSIFGNASGTTLPFDMYTWWDHAYVSGK